jgi:hypothetical protein
MTAFSVALGLTRILLHRSNKQRRRFRVAAKLVKRIAL